jgi:outer membrane protein assembly factor BamB
MVPGGGVPLGIRIGGWNWSRKASVVAAAVLVVAVIAGVAYRVFAPAQVVTPARTSYPTPASARTGVLGALPAAPLIVGDRLRVYATTRQVLADGPVDATTRRTPYWSYRRWPAEVSGLVAAGNMVVTQWSDGQLIALDARTGKITWQTDGPLPEQGYLGRRTGASTIYAAGGVHTATTADGQPVVVVTGRSELRTVDLATGQQLWSATIGASCRTGALTTTANQLVTVDTCASPQVVEFRDVATGALTTRWRPPGAGPTLALTPVGCATGNSACRAIRTTTTGPLGPAPPGAANGAITQGWLVDGVGRPASQSGGTPAGGPVAAPALNDPQSVLLGDVAVTTQGRQLVARSVHTGAQVWQRTDPAPVQILAVEPGKVHLLTDELDLLTLNSATGRELSRFSLTYGQVTKWAPGYAYAANGFVAVERLTVPVDPHASDAQYYAAPDPVILAGT